MILIARAVMPLGIAALAASAGAEGLKIYPGAKLDKKSSAEASKVQAGTLVTVYTTGDALDKVAAFYKGIGKEYAMPAKPPKTPSGEQVRWAFFIMDGGKNLGTSKHWLKIQRPYIGEAKPVKGKMAASDIRDVTVIEIVRKTP